jgi:D-alanine-D-alanine ligase-like ATP-grasp enzyme
VVRGLTADPLAAEAAGISFEDLIARIVELAVARTPA